MARTFDEPALTSLVAAYEKAAEKLQEALTDVLLASGLPKQRAYQKVLALVSELRRNTSLWAQEALGNAFRAADDLVLLTIRNAPGALAAEGVFHKEALMFSVNRMMADMEKAFSSVTALAQKLLQGDGSESIGAAVASSLQTRFRNGVVSIVGRDARMHRFSLEYYGALVAQSALGRAATQATLLRSQDAGFDLVMVSSNPSTIGDYCDAYRGRVFSISGTSTRYPPLSSTPSGGPPFHPWCRHSVATFVPDIFDEDELREFADIPKQFLLNPGEVGHKRILTEWFEAQRVGT